jgi:uncharacterized protein involved in exopolysaccharide biosynthesis
MKPQNVEDMIDLRPFFISILRHWKLIAATTGLAILCAFILGFISTPVYQATATLAILDPVERFEFDSRIVSTVRTDPVLNVYPRLALADEIFNQMQDEVIKLSAGEISNPLELKQFMSVNAPTASRLIELIVLHPDAEFAGSIANLWAQEYVDYANRLFGNPGAKVEFFDEQLAVTSADLHEAEQALIDFQKSNRLQILENELLSQSELQLNYLAYQRQLALLRNDIISLRSYIESNSAQSTTLADQLTALALQLKAFDATLAIPNQFQINLESDVTTTDPAQQLELLANLQDTVDARLAQIVQELAEIEPRTLDIQTERAIALAENTRLTRDRDIVAETYLTLARKADQETIIAEDEGFGLRIANPASVPSQPLPTLSNQRLLIAGLIGLVIGVGISILLGIRRPRSNDVPVEQGHAADTKEVFG